MSFQVLLALLAISGIGAFCYAFASYFRDRSKDRPSDRRDGDGSSGFYMMGDGPSCGGGDGGGGGGGD